MTTAEKKSFLVRYPVLSYYLMSCAFFWTLLGLFGAIVVGVLQVDPNTQPWTVWIVTIVGLVDALPVGGHRCPGYTRP